MNRFSRVSTKTPKTPAAVRLCTKRPKSKAEQMCKSKAEGGQRCHAHALTRYRNAARALEKAQEALHRTQEGAQARKSAQERVDRCQERVMVRQRELDSTPQQMVANVAELSMGDLNDPEQRAVMRERIEEGFATRLAQNQVLQPEKDYLDLPRQLPEGVTGRVRSSVPAQKIHFTDKDFPIYEADPEKWAVSYHQGLENTRLNDPFGCQVSPLAVEDIKKHRLFVGPHGYSGVAVHPSGYVTAGFSDPAAPFPRPRGSVPEALKIAVREGKASHLDCYDTYLPGLYRRAGFTTVASVPFNPDYQPDNWNEELMKEHHDGKPPVVFMVRKDLAPDAGTKEFIDYEDASNYTETIVRKKS